MHELHTPSEEIPSLHGRKSTPTPKFLGAAKAYFVCHIGPNFQLSLIYAVELWILVICQKSRSCMTTVLTVQTTDRNNNTYM